MVRHRAATEPDVAVAEVDGRLRELGDLEPVAGERVERGGLPYATHPDAPPGLVARLRAGLARAFADPELAHTRSMLLLDGFDVLPDGFYDCMFEAEAEAKRRCYLELV